MRTESEIRSDLRWKHARLRDSQEHSEIVRLEAQINQLQNELAQVLSKKRGN